MFWYIWIIRSSLQKFWNLPHSKTSDNFAGEDCGDEGFYDGERKIILSY